MTTPSHVLLLDDDNASNFLLQLVLREIGVNAQIHTFTNPVAALEFLGTQANIGGEKSLLPQWMFVDINMPVLNGFEFMDELAQIPGLAERNVHTVVITSSTYPKDEQESRRFRLAGYIVKPITPEKLQEVMGLESNR